MKKNRIFMAMVWALLKVVILSPCGQVLAAEPAGVAADSPAMESAEGQSLPAGMDAGCMQPGAVAVGGVLTEGTKLKVYVAVQVLPDAAGMDHVNIQFRNLENDRSITKILRDRDFVNGVYAGWLELSIFEPAGTFVLDRIVLQNKEGIYAKYCRSEDLEEKERYLPLPVTAAFRVDNGVEVLDETPPVPNAVVVNPVQAERESEIQVLIAVTDDFSGVESVSVRFENENGKAASAEAEWNGELYIATIKKSQTKDPGIWRIRRLTVTDHMGNSKVYRGGDGPFASDVFYIIQ